MIGSTVRTILIAPEPRVARIIDGFIQKHKKFTGVQALDQPKQNKNSSHVTDTIIVRHTHENKAIEYTEHYNHKFQ